MKMLEILQVKREEILAIAASHGASNVRIFGSVARGEAETSSDVDFLVEFDATTTLFDLVALKRDLEDLLGRKVDVLTENSLHWYIRDAVLGEAVRL
jgi:uncharacterized protein